MRSNRTKFACLLVAVVGILAATGPSAAEPATGAEKHSGLLVERVSWGPVESGGGVIGVEFRLIGVQELPRHPSVTYVMDPQTQNKVMLRRVAMLPATADDPADAPLATLQLLDEEGIIRPGQRVTVVVAGLVQPNVLVEAPGAESAAAAKGDAEQPLRVDTVPEDATLEVVKLRLSAGGFLLDLRYRVSGVGMVLADEHTTYIEHAETGDKLYVLGVARIGTLATKDAGPTKTSYLLIQNPDRRIKSGDRVNVVVAGIRLDDVQVE